MRLSSGTNRLGRLGYDGRWRCAGAFWSEASWISCTAQHSRKRSRVLHGGAQSLPIGRTALTTPTLFFFDGLASRIKGGFRRQFRYLGRSTSVTKFRVSDFRWPAISTAGLGSCGFCGRQVRRSRSRRRKTPHALGMCYETHFTASIDVLRARVGNTSGAGG